MNNKRGAAEKGLIQALILAIGIVAGARAGISYLPLTGPPALRILAVKSPKTAPVLLSETATKPAVTNAPALAANSCIDTNPPTLTADFGSYGTNFMGNLSPISISAGNPLGISAGQVIAMPTPEMFGLTPQALSAYFQPTPGGTNGPAATDPFRITFVPPLAQPDKSSHAEYIVK